MDTTNFPSLDMFSFLIGVMFTLVAIMFFKSVL